MCESKVFLEQAGERQLVLEDVSSVIGQGDEWLLTSIFWEKNTVRGALVEMRLLDHEIVFRAD
jgi:predicted RNA-binding protein